MTEVRDAEDRRTQVEAAFTPSDPPRGGLVALYRLDGGPLPEAPGDPGLVGVVADATGTVREVPAVLLRPERACEHLLTAPAHTGSARVWGLAARKALELVAAGRIAPGLDAEGAGAWRIAGIDGEDADWLHRLADAMPQAAYAATVDGRLPDPHRLLRAFLDAVADSWSRSPAVTALLGEHALTAERPIEAPEFARAAARLARSRDRGHGPALVVEPRKQDVRMRALVFDRSDPARLLAAAEAGVPEADLRLGLSRLAGASGWRRLLHFGRSEDGLTAVLDHDDLAYLFLRDGIGELRELGIEVRVDARVEPGPSLSLAIEGPETEGSLFSLDRLLGFRWQAALAGRELTAAELDRIADSHGPLVRVGDRWVLVDDAMRAKLARRLDAPAPLEALRAALTGTVEVDGDQVPVASAGPLNALRGRLRSDAATVPQPEALQGNLRDYQLRGLNWLTGLAELGLGACLADDMGLGKTITLLAHHLHRQTDPATAGPALVVCPASLMANWAAEAARFAPGLTVRRFHGPGRTIDALGPAEMVLTTYATMRLDAETLAAAPWSLVCADEAQHVKNPASATAKALRGIKSGARVALTGTPVENNLTDLWSILDWTTPGLLGSREAFRAAYGRAAEQGDPETAARLGELVRPFMLRRLKTDPGIAPELPAKTLTDQHVRLSKDQVALYKRVVDETMAEIRAATGIERRGLVLALLTRLKQVCNHPAHYSGAADPAKGKSGKLELVDELLDTILAEDERTLVFTQYTAMGDLLLKHLARRGVQAAFLNGKTPVKKRETMVNAFQDGETPVLLLSLKAAGVGLNLTRATHVIHYDRWWNPAAEDQATDRAYRIGQTRPVQVHRLVCEGTLEERIAELLERKRDLADAVVGSGEAALTELSDDQLLELVRLEER
ncbi:DEAD/DEAH box helicase [Glycomyces sp. A-F 0318]|uniref:DEAD/DEAH box helicase n=1 Tax=Glycomyces amatae TaxID=2881355 RepID=UPI001E31B235|nr:DEAD/DEAH box helicase [Glycomyces amatae]